MLAVIIKLFYDIDVLDEDNIIAWYGKSATEESLTDKERAIRSTVTIIIFINIYLNISMIYIISLKFKILMILLYFLIYLFFYYRPYH